MANFQWPSTFSEAIALQRELATRVRCEDDGSPIRTIGGIDVSTPAHSDEGFAAIVVLSFPDLQVQEVAHARMTMPFPYIPGLLSFRESPVVLRAWKELKIQPDLLMIDGQGRAHPRRLGIACHLGLMLDRPAIGCAKSRLIGTHEAVGWERGSQAALLDHGELVGYVVRTKDRVNPVYVSCGHRISPESAVNWVLASAQRYRLPEPTRQAHLAANAFRLKSPREAYPE